MSILINNETKLRSYLGYKLFKKNDLILTLGWNGGKKTKSISEKVKKHLIAKFDLPSNNIISIPFSKDTVGDAFFSREYLLTQKIPFKSIIVITSDWHLKRSRIIFNAIYNNDPKLMFCKINSKKPKYVNEESSLKAFYKTFEYTNFKDFEDVKKTIFSKHPLYNQL